MPAGSRLKITSKMVFIHRGILNSAITPVNTTFNITYNTHNILIMKLKYCLQVLILLDIHELKQPMLTMVDRYFGHERFGSEVLA